MSRKRMFKEVDGFDEYLRNAYVNERKTMKQIADELSCSPATVLNHLRRNGIKTRSLSDYPPSEETINRCRQLGLSRKGYKMSEEQRKRLSESKKGKVRRTDYEFGGHEKKRPDGYIKVYVPSHPNSTADGYVMKHILVIEREIGRHLEPNECVHHINHIRDDNRIENLRLMTKHDHMSMHMKERHESRRNTLC